MKIPRSVRAVGRGLSRAPGAAGRGVARAVRSRILPWALLVLALVGAGYLARGWHQEQVEQDRTKVVVAVARQFATALTNFQAATIGRDVSRIRSFAVGDFAEQVDQFFDAEAVAKIKDAEARSVGRISSVFVQTLNGPTASVFGVVTEIVTNKASPTPTTETVRLNIQMIQTAAGWKVSKVDILQSAGTSPLGA
jgi:hypothetical protein